MNSYQRLSLINEIAYKLQQEMTTTEINMLLGPYNLKSPKQTSVGSKRVYVQGLLSDEQTALILRVANDIGIDTKQYSLSAGTGQDLQSVWLAGKKRAFISHLARDKEKASKIQHYLMKHGVSAFVAHEDIEPAQDWQVSIESALKTMDYLVALMTPGFSGSVWTNQEIGYALGLGKLVIAVRIGDDPPGFIARFQGVPGKGRLPKDIVEDIVRIAEGTS